MSTPSLHQRGVERAIEAPPELRSCRDEPSKQPPAKFTNLTLARDFPLPTGGHGEPPLQARSINEGRLSQLLRNIPVFQRTHARARPLQLLSEPGYGVCVQGMLSWEGWKSQRIGSSRGLSKEGCQRAPLLTTPLFDDLHDDSHQIVQVCAVFDMRMALFGRSWTKLGHTCTV